LVYLGTVTADVYDRRLGDETGMNPTQESKHATRRQLAATGVHESAKPSERRLRIEDLAVGRDEQSLARSRVPGADMATAYGNLRDSGSGSRD
jgi:hypothetical protein